MHVIVSHDSAATGKISAGAGSCRTLIGPRRASIKSSQALHSRFGPTGARRSCLRRL
jgi:hypothetical protein